MEDLETLLAGKTKVYSAEPLKNIHNQRSPTISHLTIREQSLGKEYSTLLCPLMNSTYLWGKALLCPANTALLQIPISSGSDTLSTPSSEMIPE